MQNIFMSVVKKWGWYLFWLFKIQENKVIATCFKGNAYSDNPKYLVEELLKRKKGYKIYWELRDEEDAASLPEGVIPLKYESFKSLYHFATAKFWIDNARKNAYVQKRKGQYYIQTWHGGFALKKVEKDAANELPAYYIKSAQKDSEMADLFIADSEFAVEIFRKSFWYNGPVQKCGVPRNDIIINRNEDKVREIRQKLGLARDEKIILYAPTYRKSHDLSVYDINFEICVKCFAERFGGTWRMGLKLHPGMRESTDELKLKEKGVYDFSGHMDIQELYLISDVLITDYSSVMFDYMITGRPCVIFTKDLADYKKQRGFNVEIEELPFQIVQNVDELKDYLSEYSEEDYKEKLMAFIKQHDFVLRGTASQEIVDWMEQQK